MYIQLSLGSAAFFMDEEQDLDIDTALNMLTTLNGWHKGASLDMDDRDIDALIRDIDNLIIS